MPNSIFTSFEKAVDLEGEEEEDLASQCAAMPQLS